jgi:probable phosphoglycerate mutase
MTQIVLIRPGATEFNEQGRVTGTLDIPLSETGAGEVARASEQLRELGLNALYCSPGVSARQTADAIGQILGIKSKILPNMQNLNHGLWQGMLIDDIRRKHPKVFRQWQEMPESIRPPEGEMIEEARSRIQTTLRKLLKKQKQTRIGLVVPEPLATLVRSCLDLTPPRDMLTADGEHCTWESLEVEPTALALNG